jgi:hypothetical protein
MGFLRAVLDLLSAHFPGGTLPVPMMAWLLDRPPANALMAC